MSFQGHGRRHRATPEWRHSGVARSRGSGILRVAGLCLFLLSSIVGGCEMTPSRPGEGEVPLHVRVRFIGISDSTQSAMGASGNPGSAGVTYSIEGVRARAFEVLGGGTDTLRAAAEVTVPAGATQFALELNVPPAAHYRLSVDASGTRRLLDGRRSGNGSLFLGDAIVDEVTGGASRDVSIDLHDIVPLLSPPTQLGTDRYLLSWSHVPGASRYWLNRAPDGGPPIAVAGVSDTVQLPSAKGASGSSADEFVYRVQAELPPRALRSAPSESVAVALPLQVPPAAVTDLSATWITDDSVLLTWTAPGDDGTTGQASSYDVRYSDQLITGLNGTWDAATQATNESRPKPAGSSEGLTIGGLSPSVEHWFALRTADEAPNWSELSNVANVPPRTGACCFADGSCAISTSAGCANQNGQFQGGGTACNPNPCPQPVGACCFADGSCTVVTSAQCGTQQGTYRGDATTCSPNPCTQPTGACCFTDGLCQMLTAGGCGTQGGAFQGNGTACSPNPCTQPTGACCFDDGHCTVLTATDCSTQGGAYRGNATTCSPNPCVQPTGACCFADGRCTVLTAAVCATQGGTYQGNLTTCSPNPCPPPTGACCFADGHCAVMRASDCVAQSGTYQGDSITCDPNPCPQPTGACCFHDGHCASLTSDACFAQGGTYQGNATSCSPNPCPQPTGACCFHDGHCAVDTQAQCTSAGGTTWTIDGVCNPNPCPQPTGACCFHDGHCTVVTEAQCTSDGGTGWTIDGVCSPNPCTQPTGACCFHDGHCTVETQAQCATAGGTSWTIDGTCNPNLCPPPTGSCCFSDGHCTVVTQAQCTAAGGTIWTMDGTCSPNPCPIPDLLIASGDPVVNPTTVIAGDSVTVAAITIANGGTAAAGAFTVGYYLSLDQTITSDDVLLGRVQMSGLDVGGEAILPAIKLQIPVNTPAGSYYLGVFADDANVIPESNEANNTASTPLGVQTPGPK